MAAQEHAAPPRTEQQRRSERTGARTPTSPTPPNTSDHVIDRQQVSWNKRSPDLVTTGSKAGWCLRAAIQFCCSCLESGGEEGKTKGGGVETNWGGGDQVLHKGLRACGSAIAGSN